jgi:hypothetical protein
MPTKNKANQARKKQPTKRKVADFLNYLEDAGNIWDYVVTNQLWARSFISLFYNCTSCIIHIRIPDYCLPGIRIMTKTVMSSIQCLN